MLVNMKEMLEKARREGYAVIAPSIESEQCIAAAIEVAEEMRSPLILSIRINAFDDDLEFYIGIARMHAIRATVPVAINLDHGRCIEDNIRAIHYGYTSMMVDRSAKPYEENVKEVAEMVKLAHMCGMTVEGELGELGWTAECLANSVSAKYVSADEMEQELTSPDMAADFVNRTGVDCLAVSLGNKAGVAPDSPDYKPLDLDLLKEIASKTPIPLVLHGSSGAGKDVMQQAVKLGISKVNVGTNLRGNAGKKILSDPVRAKRWVFQDAKAGYKEPIADYMRLFGSVGKADK